MDRLCWRSVYSTTRLRIKQPRSLPGILVHPESKFNLLLDIACEIKQCGALTSIFFFQNCGNTLKIWGDWSAWSSCYDSKKTRTRPCVADDASICQGILSVVEVISSHKIILLFISARRKLCGTLVKHFFRILRWLIAGRGSIFSVSKNL
jgi:hypothetical protein